MNLAYIIAIIATLFYLPSNKLWVIICTSFYSFFLKNKKTVKCFPFIAKQQQKTYSFLPAKSQNCTAGNLKILFLFVIACSFSSTYAGAQTLGDYRSKATGNWNVTSTWEYFDGSAWVNASSTPTNANGTITLRSPYTVTVTANVNVDQVIIEVGALLIHNNGTLKIMDGTGTDLTAYGNLEINAQFTLDNNSSFSLFGRLDKFSGGFTINAGAKVNIENGGWFKRINGTMTVSAGIWTIKAGGTYEDGDNGASLPIADWQTNSTCYISGGINYSPGNLGQDFYHLTWNCPNQTNRQNLGGGPNSVVGNFTLISTGTGGLLLTSVSNQSLTVSGDFIQQGGKFSLSESGDFTLNIGGNFSQTGGTFLMTDNSSSIAGGRPILNVSGSFSLSNATFDACQYTGSNTAVGFSTLNLAGNINIGSGGILTETATNTGKSIVNFNGTVQQILTNSGTISNTIDFNIIAGAQLNLGNQILNGSGNFTTNANSTLYIGSAQGITSSGSTGNIQVTGSRTFNSSGTYVYNGSSAQVTGSGLPTSVKDLNIDNANNVSVSAMTTVTGNLTLTNGSLNSNGYTITLGSGTSNIGTLTRTNGYILGTLKRWINTASTNYVFPIVTNAGNYKEATINFTSTPASGGTITAQYIVAAPGNNGLPLTESSYQINNTIGDGYWYFFPSDGFSGGQFTLNLIAGGTSGITDPSQLRILSRANSSSSWSLQGGHVAGSFSNSMPTASRMALTTAQQFSIAQNSLSPLPVQLISFNASRSKNSVIVNWSTAFESNNDYFTLERSENGSNFYPLATIKSRSNGSLGGKYFFEDKSPLKSKSFYRLKQMDTDGRFTIFQIISVAGIENETAFSIERIGPSPFTTEINITCSSPAEALMHLTLYTAQGHLFLRKTIPVMAGLSTIHLNELGQLPSGMYHLVASTGEYQHQHTIIK